MSTKTTNAIHHHPGSPGYEKITTHLISITGPKAQEIRDFFVANHPVTQIFPPQTQSLEDYCRLQFPQSTTLAQAERAVFDGKLKFQNMAKDMVKFAESK